MPLVEWTDQLSIGIPEIDEEHQKLVEKVEHFQHEFCGDGRRITGKMMEFLKYWLTNHIQVEDKAFGSFFARIGS